MQINIYQDPMQKAYLFGTAVLYSEKPIPREDVPQHWSCYELRGTGAEPDRPYALVDMATEHFAGSILSPLPLKKESAQSKLVRGKLELTPEYVQMAEFCSEYQIPMPQTPIRHMLRPASSTESGLFYALPPERDEELGAIGHVRIDFGYRGHACMENGAVDVAKLLLDQGMDLDQYKEWAKRQSHGLRCDDTLASLEEHWAELQAQNRQLREEGQGEEQPPAEPGMGGMTIG